MTAAPWPFSSAEWGTDIDDTVELLPWTARTIYSISTPVAFGQVEQIEGRPGWWPTLIPEKTQSPRSLPRCLSPEEGMAAVERLIAELAAET
jgi:hypothetical protein